MRRYVVAFLALNSAAFAQDQHYSSPDAMLACDTLPVEQRDQAGIIFTVSSTETTYVQYGNGNWVDLKKTTLFTGEATLKYAYAATCAGINPDHLEGQPARERQEDDRSAGEGTVPADGADYIGLFRDPSLPAKMSLDEMLKSLPPEIAAQMPKDFEIPVIDQAAANASILAAVDCVGSTEVQGSGTGYDSTHSRQPNYAFDISGSWQADANNPGTTQGCNAGAIIDFRSGEVRLNLEPGPGRIRTVKSYNNFRGVEEQPEEAFPGVPNGVIDLHFFIDDDPTKFDGTLELPDVRPSPDTLVETVVTYAYSMAS